jgi:hypothetical protein
VARGEQWEIKKKSPFQGQVTKLHVVKRKKSFELEILEVVFDALSFQCNDDARAFCNISIIISARPASAVKK